MCQCFGVNIPCEQIHSKFNEEMFVYKIREVFLGEIERLKIQLYEVNQRNIFLENNLKEKQAHQHVIQPLLLEVKKEPLEWIQETGKEHVRPSSRSPSCQRSEPTPPKDKEDIPQKSNHEKLNSTNRNRLKGNEEEDIQQNIQQKQVTVKQEPENETPYQGDDEEDIQLIKKEIQEIQQEIQELQQGMQNEDTVYQLNKRGPRSRKGNQNEDTESMSDDSGYEVDIQLEIDETDENHLEMCLQSVAV